MIYIMALAMALLTVSCQKNGLETEVDDGVGPVRTLLVGVAEDPDTRVGFDGSNSFYWHKGDKIGVLTVTGFK